MVEKTHTAGLFPSLYEPLRHLGTRIAEWVTPASDASTDEIAYSITLELPGVEEKDIEITARDHTLMIKGEKRASHVKEGANWFFQERQYGSFHRSFRLPADADPREVQAHLKNGVLTVTIPRRPSAAEVAARIPITGA